MPRKRDPKAVRTVRTPALTRAERRGDAPPAVLKAKSRWRHLWRLKHAEYGKGYYGSAGSYDETKDRNPSGQMSALIVSVGKLDGGVQHSARSRFAFALRKRMRPINRAPAKVFDGAGRLIATIVVDPVTGQRTRQPIDSSTSSSGPHTIGHP